MLDERKAAILRAVVEEYIETAQPVGSGHVAPAVNVSSATVRNELATLEQEGYLHQPHTSAGRVPTEKGYRYFVDSLSGPGTLGASGAGGALVLRDGPRRARADAAPDEPAALRPHRPHRGRGWATPRSGDRSLRAAGGARRQRGTGRRGAVERLHREAHARAR